MAQKKALLIVTENNWLYFSIKRLFPEIKTYQYAFDDKNISKSILRYEKLFIAVDSLIFLRGQWTALHKIQSLRNNVTIIWLTRPVSGRLFPLNSHNDPIISQHSDLLTFKERLGEILSSSRYSENVDRVMPVDLTRTERLLLPYFIAGVDFREIAKLTGCAFKSLYTHRQRITIKAGFKHQSYLFYIYESNMGVIGLFSPESVGG